MTALSLTLWFCLISIQIIVHGKKHLLGSNEKERTTKCGEEACDFVCLATKCGNEHIVIDEDKHALDWMGIMNVHCTEQFSCMGRVTIDGAFSKKWKSHRIELSKLYCNNAAKHSCQGAQFIFIDTKNQYLIGDVRESDILFKNADSANIVVTDDTAVTEQFFLNQVFTHNVMEMNIIALAPYSMVGSIFDLSGVYKRITIQCKGEGSCSGSLFIFNRCMIRPYSAAQILCGINACNGISVWVLDEDDKCNKIHPESYATHFREIVQIIPFVSDHELNAEETETFAKRWTEQKQKDVFVMVENEEFVTKKAIQIKQWSVLKKKQAGNSYHVKEDTGFWRRLCSKQTEPKQTCKYNGDAFKVHHTDTKSKWFTEINNHLKELSQTVQSSLHEAKNNEWIRNPSGVEYYGGVMIEGMAQKMAVGVGLGFTAALGTILAGHSALIAVAHILHPLLIPGIVLVGAAFFVNSIREKNKARLQFPESKANFEVDKESKNGESNAAHEAIYNELMNEKMYDTNWIEVDENGYMVEYDLLTGNKHHSDAVFPLHHLHDDYSGDYNAAYVAAAGTMQIFIAACAVVCCCCAFCFGGLFGFVFRRNVYNRK